MAIKLPSPDMLRTLIAPRPKGHVARADTRPNSILETRLGSQLEKETLRGPLGGARLTWQFMNAPGVTAAGRVDVKHFGGQYYVGKRDGLFEVQQPSSSLESLYDQLQTEQAQVAAVVDLLRDGAHGATTKVAKGPRSEVALVDVPTATTNRDVSSFEPNAAASAQELQFKKVLVLGSDGALYVKKSLREPGPAAADLVTYARVSDPESKLLAAARSLVGTYGLRPGGPVYDFVRGGSLLR